MKALKITAVIVLLFIVLAAAVGFLADKSANAPPDTKNPDSLVPAAPPETVHNIDVPSTEGADNTPNLPQNDTPVKISFFYEPYWTLTFKPSEMKKGDLILINDQYSFDPDEAKNLVSIAAEKNSSYLLTDKNGSLSGNVLKALNKMMDGFAAATGRRNVSILSSYRTVEKQQQLFDERVARSGIEEAKKWVAVPGYSEHHSGMAFDLAVVVDGIAQTFKGNGDYSWFEKHCFEYGFIRRYPPEKVDITKTSYEPWHFRYIGQPHAAIMDLYDLCFEEYIDFLRDFPFGGEHYFYETGGYIYEIYYIEGLDVSIPKYQKSTVSGNNVDGFIVTVEALKVA